MSPKKRKKRVPTPQQALASHQLAELRSQSEKRRLERLELDRSLASGRASSSNARASVQSSNVSYDEKYRVIKGYVNFTYKHPSKLGPRNKAKITRIYKIVTLNKIEGNVFVPTASKKRKNVLNHFSGAHVSKYFRGGWLPELALGPNGKVIWKPGNIFEIQAPQLPAQTFIAINAKRAFKDPLNYLVGILKGYPETGAIYIPVQKQGIHKASFRSKDQFIKEVIRWFHDYNGNPDHRLKDWFLGVKILMGRPDNYEVTQADKET